MPAGGGASSSSRLRRHLATPETPAVTLAQAARRVGVSPETLRRWPRRGLAQRYDGEWALSAIGTAASPKLKFERIGEVRLKRFGESAEVFIARRRAEP
ncbi:MAG: hypothetical protein ACR2NR_20120 [Solirubrobacteraceae bacterium]